VMGESGPAHFDHILISRSSPYGYPGIAFF
jgi:hypothetical protein